MSNTKQEIKLDPSWKEKAEKRFYSSIMMRESALEYASKFQRAAIEALKEWAERYDYLGNMVTIEAIEIIKKLKAK